MLSQFIRFIKRLLNCGICKEAIELEDKYIILLLHHLLKQNLFCVPLGFKLLHTEPWGAENIL